MNSEQGQMDHLEAQDRASPKSKVVHDAVMQEGMDELRRPSAALAWSGLAAGLSMGLSMIAEVFSSHSCPRGRSGRN